MRQNFDQIHKLKIQVVSTEHGRGEQGKGGRIGTALCVANVTQ